jgi:hypothetical protein
VQHWVPVTDACIFVLSVFTLVLPPLARLITSVTTQSQIKALRYCLLSCAATEGCCYVERPVLMKMYKCGDGSSSQSQHLFLCCKVFYCSVF